MKPKKKYHLITAIPILLFLLCFCVPTPIFASSSVETNRSYQRLLEQKKELARRLAEAKRVGNLQRVITLQREIEKCQRSLKTVRKPSHESFKSKSRKTEAFKNMHEVMGHEAMRHESIKRETMGHETMGHESMRRESIKHEAMRRETVKKEVRNKGFGSSSGVAKTRREASGISSETRGMSSGTSGMSSGTSGMGTVAKSFKHEAMGKSEIMRRGNTKPGVSSTRPKVSSRETRSFSQPRPVAGKNVSKGRPSSTYGSAAVHTKSPNLQLKKTVTESYKSQPYQSVPEKMAKADTRVSTPAPRYSRKDKEDKKVLPPTSYVSPDPDWVETPVTGKGRSTQKRSSPKAAGRSGVTGAGSGKPLSPESSRAGINTRAQQSSSNYDHVDLSKLVKNSKPSSGKKGVSGHSGSTEPTLTPQQAGVEMPGRDSTFDPQKPSRKTAWKHVQHDASSKVRRFGQIKKTVDDEAYNYNTKRQDLRDAEKYPGASEGKARLKKSIGESRQVLERAPQVKKNLYHKIQGDPVAIDRINRGSPETRREFNKVKGEVIGKTKENLRERLAKRYHTDPKNIKIDTYSFPKKPGDTNVGHDVDVSGHVRVNGREREIPGEVIEKELPGAYKKAAGNPKLNPKEANIHGVSHNSKEGLGFYPGEQKKLGQNPGSSAHDPHGYAQQFGDKVEGPGAEAHKLHQKGDMVGAERNRYESQRELSKMGRETVKRVEAHGGKVSEHVKKSLEIVNQAGKPGADGNLTSPKEVEARLRARGETPGTLRSKLEGNNAGVEVLKEPGKGISDKARADAFTERVKNRSDLNRMEAGREPVDWDKGLKKPSGEGLKPGETRTGKKPLTEGVSSFKKESAFELGKKNVGRALDATGAAGMLASGARKEAEDAAKEGRKFSKFRALENVGKDIVHGSVVSPFETGKKAAREELKKIPEYEKSVREGLEKNSGFKNMPKEEQDKLVHQIARRQAAAVATGKALKGVFYDSTHDMSKKILEEEALKEYKEAKAAGEGDKLSAGRVARYKARAAARVAGELTGINAVADWATYDSKADRQAADMQRRLEEHRKTTLLAGLAKTQRLKEKIEDLRSRADDNDPEAQKKLQELQGQYNEAVRDVKNANKKMSDSGDPFVAALQNNVKKLPEPSEKKEPPAAPDKNGKDNTKTGGNTSGDTTDANVNQGNDDGTVTEGQEQGNSGETNPEKKKNVNDENPGVSVGNDNLYGGPDNEHKAEVGANSVGDDKLYKDTSQGQGDSSPQPTDNVDNLRDAETGGGNGKNLPNQANIALANKMNPNTSGSALQENDTRSNRDTQNTQQVAALTQAERSTGAQAQGNVAQNRIDTGAQTEQNALSHAADTHQSAESAADVQRSQPTFGGALMQGLTGGVAQGLDQAFSRAGQSLGKVASNKLGITNQPLTDTSSHDHSSGGSSGNNRPGTNGSGGSSGNNTPGTNGSDGSGNTHGSPLHGTLSGSWGGDGESGSFTMIISGGSISGSYSGSQSGGLSGSISPSGDVRATSGSASGEYPAVWTGSIKYNPTTGTLSGSGSWNADLAAGSWSGGGG